MEKQTPFLNKVLSVIDPQGQFTEETLHPVLAAPSQSEAVLSFVRRIEQASAQKEKVLVAGDYDCDGIMATSIMVSGLRSLGLETGFYIPDRIREGYGLSPSIVRMAAEKGYSLIITVDNGVKALKALEEAERLSIDVIVTDHHTMEEDAPCSLTVHPAFMEEPFQYLCGAGVAYECMRALKADTTAHLIWAAIASIGDVMTVKGQTRAIIQQGLALLNSQGEMHIQSLSRDAKITETTAAFQVVPAINAVGRLADMANSNNLVRWMLSSDPAAVYRFAGSIREINARRKSMSEQMSMQAAAKVRPAHPVLLASSPSFHEGIIGLIAGQLASQFQKPAITAAENADCVKCSMRSPEGFHCLNFLRKFDRYQAIGGHAQAAGFTVALEDWEDFKKFVFRQGLKEQWTPAQKQMVEVSEEDLTIENVESLDWLRPFGPGLSEPVFELKNPQITSIYDLSQGRHRKFGLKGGANALHFNQSDADRSQSSAGILAFRGHLGVNEYQSRKSVSFILDEIEYPGQ
ncbi:MAG: DHH family phosphoesterase [Erysipelotrichaceae bacterium]|nr:DHH family phosphoesterase [Erysipelotrichaceae bacterium]